MQAKPQRSSLPKNAFQVDCSTVIDGHSDYRESDEIMEDLVAVLNGEASDQIDGRTRSHEKNTFRAGPEPEEDDSYADGE